MAKTHETIQRQCTQIGREVRTLELDLKYGRIADSPAVQAKLARLRGKLARLKLKEASR